MKINSLAVIGMLVSTIILTGCGSDDQAQPQANNEVGANYSGRIDRSEITDADTARLSEDADIIVKAITFYEYQENIEDYSPTKYYGSIRLAEYLKLIVDSKLPELSMMFGNDEVELPPVEGACGGLVEISGTVSSLSLKADKLCEEYNANLSFEISGQYTYEREFDGYSITFNNSNILLDYTEQWGATDERITGEGEIEYTENSTFSTLNVNTSLIDNGVEFNSNVTLTCANNTENCHFKADILAENGLTYRIDDLNTSLISSGYYGGLDLYIPDYGKFILHYSAITYCENGDIKSGIIRMIGNDNNGAMITTYTDCGVSESYYDPTSFLK
jgi:hypothetical protein